MHKALGSSLSTGVGRGTRLGCKLVAVCLSSMPKLWVQPSMSPGEGGGGDGGEMGVGVDGVGEGASHYGESLAKKTMSLEL